MNRTQAIKGILNEYDDGKTLFVTTDGLISREFYGMKQKNVFTMTGSMGLAPAIGLGIALNTKKRVVCVNGDGAYAMSLGTQILINHYNLPNLVHIVLDNRCYETTGGQKMVKVPRIGNVIITRIKKGGEKPPRIGDLRKITRKFKKDII